jgi:hypothetical protein
VKHKIASKNLINPIFATKTPSKDVFVKLGLKENGENKVIE